MVAKDTVVGIVGAAVLIAVMTGVFLYEFNKDGAGAGGLDEDEQDHFDFKTRYPSLDSQEDIDGDGTPNQNDTDLDGDGIENGSDNETGVTAPVSGSIGAGDSAPKDTPLFIGSGNVHLVATVSYMTVLPAPAPAQPTLVVELLDSSGGVEATGTPSQSGSTVTVTIEAAGGLPPGDYTLRVRAAQTSATPANFSGEIQIHYE